MRNQEASSEREGALISFSIMKSALAPFSSPGVFGSFVGTKEHKE
ncbi:hypothetical protein [Gracilimonas sp.]